MQKTSRFAFLLSLALALHSTLLRAQTDSLIDREINEAREASYWQFGSLWLTPQFSLSALYDTNPVFTSRPHESDESGAAVPRLQAWIPAGEHVLFDFADEVRFQYYRNNANLRDVFNTAQSGIAIGGRRMLAQAHGELRTELTGPTSEFDVQTRQRTTQADSSLDFAIGNHQRLSLGYVYRRVLLTADNVEPGDMLRASRLNRREDGLSLRIARQVSPRATAVVEGTLEYIDFDEPRETGDARSIGGVAGFEFSPTGHLRGRAVLGYKRVEGERGGPEDFSGLVGSINLKLRLGPRADVQGVYSREAGPSALSRPRFFTAQSYGGFVEILLTQRLSVRPGAVLGTNSYPVPVRFIDMQGQQVERALVDHVYHYYFNVTRRMTVPWVIALDADYIKRQSDAAVFDKDRLKITLSVSSAF